MFYFILKISVFNMCYPMFQGL